MKKIFANGKFFCQPITGTQRYARELLKHFDLLLSAPEYRQIGIEILVPKGARDVPEYTNLTVRTVGWLSGTAWEQLDLPRFCRGSLLLTLSGGAPILQSRNIVTIHDAAVVAAPAGYSLAYRSWHKFVCRRMARTAEHIFTVSNFSKSEIVKWYGADPEKISVTYVGTHFSTLAADPSALARFGISGDYVLAIGAYNPNKNLARLVEAMGHLEPSSLQLVVLGGHDKSVYRKSGKIPAGVRMLGRAGDEELKALYEHAACFVFASLYEGFGFPPLEAISSGCPVVLSRVASLPEVFEGTGVFCDPHDPKDIARAIRSAVESPPSREKLKGFARNFSWEKCARTTLETILRVC